MNQHTKIIATSKYFLPAFLLTPFVSHAQMQPDIPMPRGPVDLSETSNLVIFIIIPAIIIIAYLIFRKRIKRIKEEKNERMKKKNQEKIRKD